MKYHGLGGFNNRHSFLTVPEVHVRDQSPALSGSGERLLLALQMATWSLCPHVANR